MIKEKTKKDLNFSDKMKEKSILTHYNSEEKRIQNRVNSLSKSPDKKEFLFFDPPEIIFQNIELKKAYEIPVRIHNISTTSKRILIRQPISGVFKIVSDKKQKNFQISPGLYYEFMIVFEPVENKNYFDTIEVNSENNLKITLKLNAFKRQPIIVFDPFVNFGFVPVFTKKAEKIKFINEGSEDCNIELRLVNKNTSEVEINHEKFTLSKQFNDKGLPSAKSSFENFIIYSPDQANIINQRIEVYNETDKVIVGYIDVIGTSVEQQLAVVFEEGGGPTTDVIFGNLYYGQRKDCPAFLVNNGPYEINFRIFFHVEKDRTDVTYLDDSDFACTPEQAGIEMTQRILGCNVKQGSIKPYQQLPIVFQAKTKLQENMKNWNGHICEEFYTTFYNKDGSISKKEENKIEIHKSIAAIKFEQAYENKANNYLNLESENKICKTISVFMELKTVYPEVILDKTNINFWECNIGESKSVKLKITNKNDILPVDFAFTKIPYFYTEPSIGVIGPSEFLEVIITFVPKNYGRFSNTLPFKYISGMYEIGIKIIAKASLQENLKESKKEKLKKIVLGPEATDITFIKNPRIISDEQAMNFTLPNIKNFISLRDRTKDKFEASIKMLEKERSNKKIIDTETNNMKEFLNRLEQRKEANNTIEFRKDSKSKLTTDYNNLVVNGKINLANLKGRLESPKFDIPKTHEGLWVSRPIGKYEPNELLDNLTYRPDFNPKERPEKMPELYPKSAIDKRECEMTLDGHKLQRIFVGSREINFGEIFVCSEEVRTFWIKNTLRTSIYVEILNTDSYPELKSIEPSTFVIGPNSVEGTVITFTSDKPKTYNFYIKYKINYKQQFKVKVTAVVVYANLKKNGTLSKFEFQQLNSIEMTISQKITLLNSGNAPVEFKYSSIASKNYHFSVSPLYGIVKPESEQELTFTFDPLEVDQKRDSVPESIYFEITNGDQLLKFDLIGKISPVKAEFVGSDIIDFGDISVANLEKKTFSLKCDKGPTAFQILNYPNNNSPISFEETRGNLDNKTKTIEVWVKCDIKGILKETIKIKIRGGGPPLNLYIRANAIEPTVQVTPNYINFGELSYGEQDIKTFTLYNQSNLTGFVEIDIRKKDIDPSLDFDYFKIRPSSDNLKNVDHLITDLEGRNEEEDNNSFSIIDQNEDDEKEKEEDETKPEQQEDKYENLKWFIAQVKKGEKLTFDLIFCPLNDAKTFNYTPTIKMYMKGSKIENPDLTINIFANQKDSLITLNPSEKLFFKKTFIGKSDKSQLPTSAKLIVYMLNTGEEKEQKFKIDTKDLNPAFSFREERTGEAPCYDERTKIGIIKKNPGNITFYFYFNPTEAIPYKSKITFIPYNSQNIEQEKGKEITLFGDGATPKITFDKREIILPPVPLGYESRGLLKIKNEGYGEMNLESKFITNMGNVDVKANWLVGKKIGIRKPELKLEIIYKSKSDKPLSFTIKLMINDQDDQKFSIFVHGTSDNSILTNYIFYQIRENNFKINIENDNLMLKEIFSEEDSFIDKEKKEPVSCLTKNLLNEKSFLSSTYTKSYKETLLNTCSYITLFLKNILTNNFNTFPEGMSSIQNKGENLINMIENLSGKFVDIKILKFEDDPTSKVKYQREFFKDVIVYLQEQGAFLNTVIPEYLLDTNSFKKYVKSEDKYPLNWEKTTKFMYYYKYIHLESWITLAYQIIKIYYVSRVNISNVLSSFGQYSDRDKDKDKLAFISKNNFSNFYGPQELLLFKWIKFNVEHVSVSLKGPLTIFESLLDGKILLSLLLSYLPHIDEQYRHSKKKPNMEREKTNITIDKLFLVLRDHGIFTYLTQESFMKANNRDLFLFVTMLFNNLPYFIPTVIEFKCVLNEAMTKTILLNTKPNSKKKIDYNIQLLGEKVNENFIINKDISDLRLAAGEKAFEYKVTYKAKFKKKVSATLFFLNKIEGMMYQAIPLVYSLQAEVTERKSLGSPYILRSPLYKKTEHKLLLKSPFQTKAEFRIQIEPGELRRKNTYKKRYQKNKYSNEEEYIPPVIFLKSNDPNLSYRLDPEVPKEIFIYYCPIDTDTYTANIVFTNDTVGEFQITVECSPEMPDVLETLAYDVDVNEQKDININIMYLNKYLKQAIDLLIANETSKEKQKILKTKLDYKNEHKSTFTVDIPKNHFVANNNFVIDPVLNTDKPYDSLFQTMILKFMSKSVQTIESEMIMKSIERHNDVRIYKLIIKVKPKNIYGTFKFLCPVGQEIIQQIPFHNKNDKDCIITSNFTSGKGFYCQSEKRIQKGKTENFILKFCPLDRNSVFVTLILKNNITGEIYEYKLEGIGDDPLAESMITIDCAVRNTEKRIIPFENNTEEDQIYKVTTDLADILSGQEKLFVKAKSKVDYEFTVRPLLGKTYFGKLMFHPENINTYKWYTVEVRSKPCIEFEELTFTTFIRKTIFSEIILDNPTNESICYEIEYEGDFLKGENYIIVESKKQKVYQLFYSPLKVGQTNGVIRIFNEKVGEKIIKLNLNCNDNKPFYLDTIICELGKTFDYTIILENPLDEEQQVYINQSNQAQFTIIPEKIILPENSAREIIVRYSPSQLEHPEDCTIIFETHKIGRWEYCFKGKGSFPSVMPKTLISSKVESSSSNHVMFKNPFNDRINITIELKVEPKDIDIFKLIGDKKKTVEGYKIYQIPFSFWPKNLVKYTAEIIVTSNQNLKWTFPIEGITNVKEEGHNFFFSTKAKCYLDTKKILDLSQVPEEIDINELTIEIKVKEEKYKNLIDKCLNLSLDYPIVRNDQECHNRVPLNVKFYPLRPFKTECEICLVKRSGGQWIYNMMFEALEGDPEDIIKIQSSIGVESFVSFKLDNVFTKNARFIAYFTHDSSSEFGIKPKEGILDQSGRSGNIFIISFHPIEYGKVKLGKLVIESDEIQWIFHVYGSHLEYVLPEVKSNFMGTTYSSMGKTEYSQGGLSNLKTTVTKFKKLGGDKENKDKERRSKSPKWK